MVPLADRPAMFPFCSRRSCASSRPTPVASSSTAPSARAATAARILAAGASVIAIDRDPDGDRRRGATLKRAAAGGRLTLVEGRFSDLDAIARAHGHERVDGVVLDVGVSSMQLDDAGRGFSFRTTGRSTCAWAATGRPPPTSSTASSRGDLARVIAVLGEEKRAPRRSPRAIASGAGPAEADHAHGRTRRDRRRRRRAAAERPIHPATRTFQALRIFVNRELDELAEALAASERILGEGGRLVVVAFHSLEDRIVKRFLAERSARRAARLAPSAGARRSAPPTFELLTRGAVAPGEGEIASQSAGPFGAAARGAPHRRRRRGRSTRTAIGVPGAARVRDRGGTD